MLIKHGGHRPKIDRSAWIAPNAVVCGNVTIGAGCRIMFGAQVIAESGSIQIGLDRSESNMVKITQKLSDKLGSHAKDTTVS